MMKKLLQITLTVISLIVVFAIISGGLLFAWRSLNDSKTPFKEQVQNWIETFRAPDFSFRNNFSIDEIEELDLTDIRVIEINAVSERVLIHETTGESAVRLHGQYRSFRAIQWTVDRRGDRLIISTRFPHFGFFNGLTYTLQVPRSFTGTIEASTVSGQIQLANDLSNKSSVDLSSVSGSVLTQTVQADDIRLKTVSGSIIASALNSDLVVFDTVSGSVFLDHLAAPIDGKTTSGSVQLNYDTFKDTEIRTISGSIELTVEETASISVSFSSVSGAFSNQNLNLQVIEQTNRSFEGVIGTGDHTLTVKTTSGSLLMKSP